MCFTVHVEHVLFYWYLHDMLNMYCLHAYFCRVYLLVLGQKWPNKYVQTKQKSNVSNQLGYFLRCALWSIKICEQVKQKSDCNEENRINFTAGIHVVRYIRYLMQT